MVSAKYLTPYILITAFTYVFAKDAVSHASPFVYGALTSFVSFLTFFVITRGKLVLNRDTGVFSIFYWGAGACLLVGLNYISASQSAVLTFTMPLIVIPLSVYILHERATRVEVFGALIGFSGIVVYSIPLLSGSVTLLGTVVTIGDACFWALFSIYMSKLKFQSPAQTMASASLIGFLIYGVLSFADFHVQPSLNLAFDVVYLGVFAWALNQFLWMAMIKTEKLAKLSTLTFAAPIVTLIYGVASTQVVPSIISVSGVVLIFAGIYISNLLGRRSADRGRALEPPSSSQDRGS